MLFIPFISLKYYGKNIVHPFASTIGEELFQNGFVPSETDYRVFRDFGHIPGNIKLITKLPNL